MTIDYESLQLKLSSINLPPTAEADFTRNAVIVLFCDRGGASLLAIRKTSTPGYPWSDHIAFPGGQVHASDASTLETAYRELYEELGIPRTDVALLGTLGHFQTLTGRHDLDVHLGVWRGDKMQPDAREVAETLCLNLDQLSAIHSRLGYHEQTANALGRELRYPIGRHDVWGVTARIIHFLIEEALPT